MTVDDDESRESDEYTEGESIPRYSRRVQRSPTWFNIIALKRVHDDDEPSARDAL